LKVTQPAARFIRFSIGVISFWLASCGKDLEIKVEEIEKEEEPFAGPSWEIPQGWIPGKVENFRVGSYLVEDENGSTIDILVSRIDHVENPRAGELLLNAKRWLGQINVYPKDEEEIQKYVHEYSIAGRNADWIEAKEGKQRLVVVILKVGNLTWYFKMIGDSALSQREQKNFESLLNSIRIVEKSKEVKK